jgi:hypothetical protein
MGQPASRDVGINPSISTEISVVLASVAGISGHHILQSAGCSLNARHHRLKVFDVWGLVANAHRHDHLMVAVHRHLAVVAVEVLAV